MTVVVKRKRAAGGRARSADAFPPPTVSRAALLAGGSDRDFRRLVDDLVRFSGRIQALREAIARRMGITTPQYNMLRTIAERRDGDDPSLTAIARSLEVSVPFVVTQIGHLIAARLVEKRRDPGDGRRVHLTLSAEGAAAIEAVAPFQQRVNDMLFASLTATGFRELMATARQLNDCADDALRAVERG